MPSIMQILGYIVLFLSGVGTGLLIYHHVLGSAGFFGSVAANAVEKKLNRVGKKIVGIEHKSNRGHALRNRSDR